MSYCDNEAVVAIINKGDSKDDAPVTLLDISEGSSPSIHVHVQYRSDARYNERACAFASGASCECVCVRLPV